MLAASVFGSVCGGWKINASATERVGKASYLCDYESGTVVSQQDETKHLPIASMCKIMTLLLSFEAVENGTMTYEEQIIASENASAMGGSQVFLGTGLSYTVEELMKSVAVCSANDSCVALAERIAGNEADFVAKMNARAKELGAEDTLFANCTGLPKEPQYSCAKDVATMLKALIGHGKYFEFSKVWYDDFLHPDGRTTRITNTNKLIRAYSGCDGGKTGFTSEAGFCLAATAKRGETRLISVIIGADSSSSRFDAIKAMFDDCFNRYETRVLVEGGKALDEKACVRGSKTKEISVAAERPIKVFARRGEKAEAKISVELDPDLKAPLQKGSIVGVAIAYQEGIEIGRANLVTLDDAPRMSWWEAFRETAQSWQ